MTLFQFSQSDTPIIGKVSIRKHPLGMCDRQGYRWKQPLWLVTWETEGEIHSDTVRSSTRLGAIRVVRLHLPDCQFRWGNP